MRGGPVQDAAIAKPAGVRTIAPAARLRSWTDRCVSKVLWPLVNGVDRGVGRVVFFDETLKRSR